jgi:hypothetical protein
MSCVELGSRLPLRMLTGRCWIFGLLGCGCLRLLGLGVF